MKRLIVGNVWKAAEFNINGRSLKSGGRQIGYFPQE